jgi:hypothetical protein
LYYGINHLLGQGKIDEAIKTTKSLVDSIGWEMQKRIKKDYITMSWFPGNVDKARRKHYGH